MVHTYIAWLDVYGKKHSRFSKNAFPAKSKGTLIMCTFLIE